MALPTNSLVVFFSPSVDVIQSCFKETKASLKAGHKVDVKGLLSLYEASFLVVEGEDELDEAREFVVEHLGNLRRSNSLRNPLLAEQIDHALELPLHWRMPRMHTRWFIDHYARKQDYIPALLEFAILDFNLVQSIYKEELQEMSRWWRSLDLVCDDLHFIRDRLDSNHQDELFITTIDDVYDIYGTLEELELFTDAVKEWKITESKELPHYMKMILVTLFNTIEDIAHTYYKEKGLDVLSFLKQVWVDLCKSFMVEARWYYTGYTPTFDEYLENGWISSSGIIGLTEKNVSERIAREGIASLMRKYWKKLNGERIAAAKFNVSFGKTLLNMPRTAQICLSVESVSPSSGLRRTANYQPAIWGDEYIQSLPSSFLKKKYLSRREELKEDVRLLIGQREEDLVEQLELVDSLRQLGVDYHFRLEIEGFLSSLVGSLTGRVSDEIGDDLHSTALLFRLLREYGIGHSQPSVDVIQSCFKETKASLKTGNEADVKGLLSLYEASFLVVEGEDELDEAREFVVEHLGNLRRSSSLRNPLLAEQIDHALELPLHWRMPSMHTRWFIDHYARKEDYIPALLEFAILDFNLVQSIYKEELQEMSRWWRSLDLVCDDLHFIRDRLVENYLWAAGFSFLPELGRCRTAITKMNCFITTIDDVYDIYGTLEELELFTDAVKEWKITESKELPHYMKMILVTLFNTIEDIAHTYYKEKGLDVLSFLKQVWVDLCKSFMVEARWYYTGYTPTFDEYLENGWISSSGIIGLTVSYCLSQDITANSFQDLEFYRETVRPSCTLFRFYNDLVTSRAEVKRGDARNQLSVT
ncbi:hypothetical protein HPP92_024846 [Vanilla planifolia]|uniref:Uncharacterized protein n=1 Tax=Vanilla planifolia TaxID=51239 RepID=A0A835PLK6_VANPL|nr:hypothetical protein HPP92_024846 [Vanilla planifolia]